MPGNKYRTFLICSFLSFLLSLFFSAAAAASITLRVVAVNPSDELTQNVPIKVYLPVEVKPDDVIYKDDLNIAYDTQQGSYYVFGEYPLKPKETLEKEVEITDIWQIDDAVLAGLHKEAKDVFRGFEKTAYAERAAAMYKGVEKKLGEIEDMQRAGASSNPSQHISDYRYCLSLLTAVQSDLVAAKTLLSEVAPHGAVKLSWKIIVFIIGFLAVLSLGSFLIWQYQSRIDKSLNKD